MTESALAGCALAFLARLLTHFLWNERIARQWAWFAPFQFSGTASLAMLIGIILPLLLNLIWGADWSKQRAIKKYGNDLLQLLDGAAREEKPVSITLDNRKVYIGYIVDAPNLDSTGAYVAILPMLSGYRDANTMQLEFATDYTRVYSTHNVDPADFFVTVPLAVIRMASRFDEDVYSAFRVEETIALAGGTALTPPAAKPVPRRAGRS